MKMLLIAAGLVLSPVLVAQGAKEPVKMPERDPGHFRWSQRTAHELDYGHTLRTARELTDAQKQQLFAFVLKVIRRDPDPPRSEKELVQMAWDTRVELADLDGDGQPEVIAQASGIGPCGGTGNCLFWVFQMTSEGPKAILDSSTWGTFELITVRPWSTNGYRDIVLADHGDSSGQDVYSFKFVNGAYRANSCFHADWLDDRGEARSSPELTPMRCETAGQKAK